MKTTTDSKLLWTSWSNTHNRQTQQH